MCAFGRHVLDESLQHSCHVLQAIPARDLNDERSVGRERQALAHDLGSTYARPTLPGACEQSRVAQNLAPAGGRERRVLGREGVDRRRDDCQRLRRDERRREGGPREHMGVSSRHVRTQEVPGLLRPFVAPVDAHVAAPDDASAALDERGDEAGGLRIVHDDDVVRPYRPQETLDVRGERPLVPPSLVLAQAATVTGRPVEPVVDPLGDREELGIPVNHRPFGRDARTACVAQEHVQELGHASAGRGRVDVDDPPPVQTLSRSRGDLEQTGEALGSDDRTEPSGIERLELDVQRRYVNEDGSPDSSPALSADDTKIRLRERCVVTTLLLRAKSRRAWWVRRRHRNGDRDLMLDCLIRA